MLKVAAIAGFIFSLIGGLLLALLGFAVLLFNGFMGGPKDSSAGIQAVIWWVLALGGFWGGWKIFKAPRAALNVMLWLVFFVFVFQLGFNGLDIYRTPLSLVPFALTAGLAYLCFRKTDDPAAPKS